jgi:hypothetical protein
VIEASRHFRMPFLTRFSILSLLIHIFAGLLGHGSQASENSDSIALFQSEASNMGMIYGNSLEGDSSSNVFYDNGTSDIPSVNAIGLSVEELKEVSSYPTSWDFIGKWAIDLISLMDFHTSEAHG